MKYLISFAVACVVLLGIAVSAHSAQAAVTWTYGTSFLPQTTNTFDLGSSSPAKVWRYLYVNNICLSGDCKSAWPSGGAGGGIGDPFTHPAAGQSATTATMILTGGLVSVGSTTISSLGTGFVQAINGLLSAAALTSGQITTALGFTPFGGTNPLPVANGGTNATSFPANSIITSNADGTALAATSSVPLYVSSLYSTSTSATSTLKTPILADNAPTNLSNFLNVTASRVYPASVTAGGLVNFSNGTANTGPALVLNGNTSAGQTTGRLFVVTDTNTSSSQDTIIASSSATGITTFNLKGIPTAKGILKIEHMGGGTGYSNGSAISIDTTLGDAQGLFIKTGTGPGITVLDSGATTRFKIDALGNSTTSGSAQINSLTASSLVRTDANKILSVVTVGSGLSFDGTTLSSTLTGGTGLSTTSPIAGSNVLVYSDAGAGAAYGIATSSVSLGLGLTGALTTLGSGQSLTIATSSLYTGTTGQVPYFSGTNTLTGTSTLFMDTAGRVGVGSSTPSASLSVDSTGITNINVCQGLGNSCGFIGFTASGNQAFTMGTKSNAGIFFITNNTNRLNITSSGFVGIATTTSQWGLEVMSATKPQLDLYDNVNDNHWTMRSIAGSFYLASSTYTATSTKASFAIDPNGFPSFSSLGAASGNNCLQVDTTGKLTNTGAVCSTGTVTSVTATAPIFSSGGATPNLTWAGLATTSNLTQGQLLYNTTGGNGVASVATTSATINNGLTGTLTTIGSSQTIGLATINAGVLGATLNGSTPTSQATSTLYGASTGGMVLGWDNVSGGIKWVATSTVAVASASTEKFATSTLPTSGIYPNSAIYLGLGTTTPRWPLNISTGTAPQISLSDGSLTTNPWTLRSINSNLFFATASPSTFATTSLAALTINSNGNLGIGSTSPNSKLSVGGNAWLSGTYNHFGTAVTNNGVSACTSVTNCLELVGDDNTTGGVLIAAQNINKGTSAFTGLNLLNDLSGTVTTNYAGVYLNSSVYTDTTFGTLNATPNLLQLGNSMGPVSIQSFASTSAASYINFFAGSTTPGLGPTTGGVGMTLTGNGLGIGTTTPFGAVVNISSSTQSQLRLTDGGAISNAYNFRSFANTLYISTSSPSTFATSTTFALSINPNGGLTIPAIGACSGANALTTNASGLIACGAITASGGTYPFTQVTTYATLMSATTSPLYSSGGLFASTSSAIPSLAVTQAGGGPAATFMGGNVGVGIAAPSAPLDVRGTGTGSRIRFGDSVAQWNLGVGSEAVPYVYIGGINTTSEWFWRANWNNTTDSGNTFKSPSATAAQNIFEVLGTAAQTGDYFRLSTSAGTGGDVMKVTAAGSIGISTTTPGFPLTIATSTLPQLALSAGAGFSQWTMRNSKGSFYLSTTSVTSNATSTTAALAFDTNGLMTIGSLGTAIMSVVNGVVSQLLTSAAFTLSGNTLKENTWQSFTYATSTSWTGTTTIPLEVGYGETINNVRCFTDVGTVDADFYTGSFSFGNKHLNYLRQASTTIGTTTMSTNNSFQHGTTTSVQVGTPASSPTKVTCSVSKTL